MHCLLSMISFSSFSIFIVAVFKSLSPESNTWVLSKAVTHCLLFFIHMDHAALFLCIFCGWKLDTLGNVATLDTYFSPSCLCNFFLFIGLFVEWLCWTSSLRSVSSTVCSLWCCSSEYSLEYVHSLPLTYRKMNGVLFGLWLSFYLISLLSLDVLSLAESHSFSLH